MRTVKVSKAQIKASYYDSNLQVVIYAGIKDKVRDWVTDYFSKESRNFVNNFIVILKKYALKRQKNWKAMLKQEATSLLYDLLDYVMEKQADLEREQQKRYSEEDTNYKYKEHAGSEFMYSGTELNSDVKIQAVIPWATLKIIAMVAFNKAFIKLVVGCLSIAKDYILYRNKFDLTSAVNGLLLSVMIIIIEDIISRLKEEGSDFNNDTVIDV